MARLRLRRRKIATAEKVDRDGLLEFLRLLVTCADRPDGEPGGGLLIREPAARGVAAAWAVGGAAAGGVGARRG